MLLVNQELLSYIAISDELITLSPVLSVPCIPSSAPSGSYGSSSSSAVCPLLSSLCIQKNHPFAQPAVQLGSAWTELAKLS